MILLDADDDCPAELARALARRAEAVRPDRRIRVVLAKREFEAWFLAAAQSIAGRRGIRESVAPPADPESIRDAKGFLDLGCPATGLTSLPWTNPRWRRSSISGRLARLHPSTSFGGMSRPCLGMRIEHLPEGRAREPGLPGRRASLPLQQRVAWYDLFWFRRSR